MKQFIATTCLFMFCFISSAQTTALRLSTGYNFSAGSQYFLSELEGSTGNYTYQRVDASLGRGINVAAGVDYLCKDWLGFSLDISYLKTAPPVKGNTEFNTVVDYSYSEENKWRSNIAEVSPALLLKIPGKKLNPYSRFGLLIPFYSKIKVTADYTSRSFAMVTTGKKTTIFRLQSTLGYTATAGIAPEINKKLSFVAEARLLSHAIRVKKSTLTSDIVNGTERADSYLVAQKEVIYVKKADNQPYNGNEPRKELAFSLPYSSIGLTVGLSIKL